MKKGRVEGGVKTWMGEEGERRMGEEGRGRVGWVKKVKKKNG